MLIAAAALILAIAMIAAGVYLMDQFGVGLGGFMMGGYSMIGTGAELLFAAIGAILSECLKG